MDDRLRALERRAAQGDPGAARLYLLERVRAGALRPSMLRLAAYLGDPAACEAIQEPRDPAHDLEALVQGLEGWERVARVRAGVALARAALDARSGLPDEPSAVTVRALQAAEAWCVAPASPVPWSLLAEARAVAVLTVGVDRDVAWLACEVLAAVTADDDGDATAHTVEAARLALRVLREPRAREAIRDALVPWALGLAGGELELGQ